MKKSTANKLGICSTYSTRSTVNFLAFCSNFCKPLKKNQKFVRPTKTPRQKRTMRRKKNGWQSILSSVQGTGGSPTGPDPENRVGYQDTGSPVKLGSFGLQVPGETGHWRVRSNSLGIFPKSFNFKMSFKCTSRYE